MDASDLRVFETVARLGNITKASTVLNTVQSNVTARIRSLEDELGVTLLHRHARGVTPTIAGQKLLPYASRFAQLLAEAKSVVKETTTPQGTLVFGTLETIAAIRLPPVLTRYKVDFSEVDIVMRTGTTNELVEDVLQHRLEGAFVAGPIGNPDLVEELMFAEELVLIGPRSASTFEVMNRNGFVELMVLKRGCSYRTHLESLLVERGIVHYRILELGTIEAIFGLVAAGMGISILPRIVVAAALNKKSISVESLPAGKSHVDTIFVRRRDGLYSTAAKYLVRYMKAAHSDENTSRLSIAKEQVSTNGQLARLPLTKTCAFVPGRVVD